MAFAVINSVPTPAYPTLSWRHSAVVFFSLALHPLSAEYMQGIVGPLHSFGIVMPRIMPQVLKWGWPQ